MNARKIIPAPGYALVEPLEAEKKTASGIILPEAHDEKPSEGLIVSLGEMPIAKSGKKQPLWKEIKEKAVVVYKKWSGNEYKPQGEKKELLFVKFEDILAVLK